MNYRKAVRQSDTGMVIAAIYNVTLRERVGLKFFHWPPFDQRRRLQRAHAWADEWMRNCEELCVDLVQEPQRTTA